MNPIAKAVHCPTCGSPPGRACQALDPTKIRVVPTHAARKLYWRQVEFNKQVGYPVYGYPWGGGKE